MSRSSVRKPIILLITIVLLNFAPQAIAGGLISTSMEIEIGRWVRDSMLQEYGEWEDEYDQALVQSLGSTLADLADERPAIEYEFHLLDTEEVNAFAAPGGFIFVTRGLLDYSDRNPGMLAGVIGHEIGHVEHKHSREAMEDAIYGSLGLAFLFEVLDIDDDWVETAGAVALMLMQQGHSRENEYEADRQGVLFSYRAGWDPEEGLILFLRELEKEHGSDDPLGDIGEMLASHPPTDRRIYFAEQYLEEVKATEAFIAKPFPDIPKPTEEEEGMDEDTDESDDDGGQFVLWERG